MVNGKRNYGEWSKEELIREILALKKQKTYGLVWEREKTKEDFDLFINWEGEKTKEEFSPESKDKFPVLAEIKDKEINSDKDKPVNLLIEGDNYHSLAVLNFTHKNSVDVIYIDPPYNTGNNDFKYNDRYVEREDGYRHSMWLSFMSKRLALAKNLLKDTGIIFISIDDNEQAQLRLLCNDIFGEENFLASIILKNKAGAGAKPTALIEVHEYILMYAKNSRVIKSVNIPYEESNKLFTKKDKHFSVRGPYGTWALATTSMADRPNLKYPIRYNGEEIWPEKQWLWSKERVEEAIKNEELVFNKMKNGKWSVRFKRYLKDDEGNIKNATPTTFFDGPYTHEGTKELDKILGNRTFVFPKPVGLITKLLKFNYNYHINKNAKILDFFAGSGTTGQAVMELNKADGGNRSFILCTNDENKICSEVCYPRISKITKGYTSTDKEKIEGLGGNLKYYKTDFVEAEQTDKNKRKLVDNCTEMLCIKENTFERVKDAKKFKIFKNDKIHLGIIFDDEHIDEFVNEAEKISGKIYVYVFSHDDSVPTKEFKTIKNKVTLCPIPEAILKVYRKVFKND